MHRDGDNRLLYIGVSAFACTLLFHIAPFVQITNVTCERTLCPVGTALSKWHSEGSTSFRMYPAYTKNSTSC